MSDAEDARSMRNETCVLSDRLLAFVETLRRDHAFGVGHGEAVDALRALEHVGVHDGARVRAAVRSICCSSPEDIRVFDGAFDAFFLTGIEGLAQPEYAPRHTRGGGTGETPMRRTPPRETPQDAETVEGGGGAPSRHAIATDDANDAAATWSMLRAKYSPQAGRAEPPRLQREMLETMLAAADAWVAATRLGRSRRWRPDLRGARFDMRRTLRASLQTAGDPFVVHRLGHPLRAPRFIVLLDGSRSMADLALPYLHFAAALVRRSRRASVFSFSTELREVTQTLRRAEPGVPLAEFGEAWGGGTRIGASLQTFLHDRAASRIAENTILVIASDGLDAGDAAGVEHATREFARRAAAVVWLNPHADEPGFTPSALAMRLAMPSLALLSGASDAASLRALAPRIGRAPAAR